MEIDAEILDFLCKNLNKPIKTRRGLKGCCSYHPENTPSMFIYFDFKWKNMWWFKCFGCGETGSLNKLLRRLKAFHLILPEHRFITQQENEVLQIYRTDITLGNIRNYSYFRERGISDKVSRRFGFAIDLYTPAAVMPVYCDGIYQGFVKRNLDPRLPKYFISPGMNVGNVIWGFDDVDESKPIYVTEGIIDAACLWSAGYQAVSLISKESFATKLHKLSTFGRTIYVPDNDAEGLRTSVQVAKSCGASIEFVPRPYKDISEWRTSKKNFRIK